MSEEVDAGRRRDVENRLNNNSKMCVKLIITIVIIIMLYSIASCTSNSLHKNALLLLLGGFVWLSAASVALYKLVNVYR